MTYKIINTTNNFLIVVFIIIIISIVLIIVLSLIYTTGNKDTLILSKLPDDYFEEFKKNLGIYYSYIYPSKFTLTANLNNCITNLNIIKDQLVLVQNLIELSIANTDKYKLDINDLLIQINNFKKQIDTNNLSVNSIFNI